MGNNASQSGNITQQRQQLEQEQQWAHSFPRTPQRVNQQQNKVLPDVTIDLHQKLRPTNNGDILYSGGTISGRHGNGLSTPREEPQNGVYRSSSITSKHLQEYSPTQDSAKARYYVPQQRDDMGKSSPRRSRNMHHHNSQQRELQIKRFGSVPNLRGQDASHNHTSRESSDHANRARKKYKAPAPPRGSAFMTSNGSSLDSWEMNGDTADMPVRRQRLFKTNAEMKKKPPSPQNHRRSIEIQAHHIHSNENKKYRSKSREPQKKIPELKTDKVVLRNVDNKQNPGKHKMLSEMQRSKSLPEFQAELREATQKLRMHKFNEIKQEEKSLPVKNISQNKIKLSRHSGQERVDNKLRTLDPNITKKENLQFKMRQMEKNHINEKLLNVDPNINRASNIKRSSNKEVVRGRASGKESTPEKSPPQKVRGTSDTREQPAKTFYFGMDETAQSSTFNSNVVDHFALSLQKHNCILPAQTYSGSDLSSEIDMEESQVSANGIALHLRPILPKKQLEIPRFSPAAAWRLLSAFDSNPPPSTVSDEGPVFIEDRIEKLARQPPPISLPGVGPRSSHDKSGDSGISGDAGPTGFEDTPDPLIPNLRHNNLPISSSNCLLNLSWTPQQDLDGEEESSSEGGLNNAADDRYTNLRSTTGVKFSPRSQVFSLSLPRDNHLAAYMEEKAKLHSPPNFTNLQRLKRSVSGVLGNISAKVKETQLIMTQEQNDNWFLSRSAPNSLNNGFSSLEIRLSKHNNNISPDLSDERSSSLVPIPVKNVKNPNGGRVMYLPEFLDNDKGDSYQKESNMINEDIIFKQQITIKEKLKMAQEYKDDRVMDFGLSNSNFKLSAISKSCENISSGARNSKSPFEPEDLQDPPKIEEDKRKGRKTKRFKFQSTVRQIERKRLADKLSREAERKEQQRLGELEAMQRVEEEFQRKRAKEKASIRQQLRLFSMEDTAWSSLPLNWDSKEDVPMRSEPDGAVSSSASSPTHDNIKNIIESNQLSSKELSYNEIKNETLNKISKQKHSVDSKSSAVLKKNVSRQGSESSDDTRVKAQATQVLSEYRQPRREYKDFRSSTSRLQEGNESPFHNDTKQTTVHPQVIYNMPKAHGHQGATTDGASRSNNYRRDFAHGIKSNDNYSDDSPSNSKKHSPRLTQNHSSRQGKCIS